MKILHTISSLDIKYGGPPLSVYLLTKGLFQKNINTTLLTFRPAKVNTNNTLNEKFIKTLGVSNYSRFSYTTELLKYLKENNDYDLFHGHGLWQYPNHKMAMFARKIKKPYILSPRGMLNKQAIDQSKLLKKFVYILFQKKDLEKASVLHATSQQEMEHIRSMGLINPIAVIPNPIDVPNNETALFSKSTKRIGYVGRFEKIKNIENLIHAWAMTGQKLSEWELVLIGTGADDYANSLKKLSKSLGITNIRFTGFLTGDEKNNVLSSLSYLVLPSKSENFGMVIPEALVRGIPVIASKGTPWEILIKNNAGWWIDVGIKPLVAALNEVISLKEIDRQRMGLNGRKLVEENFSTDIVSEKMIKLYKWVLLKTEKPDFIFT